MKISIKIVVLASLMVLTGCASVPMAPMAQDSQAKTFMPVIDKAVLYIYRNETFGAAIPMTVSVNGKVLGQTVAQSYFKVNLAPGTYNIASHTENVSHLPITVVSNHNYFVWQEVKMGLWGPRSLLQQVDESTGRAGVMESKLAVSAIPE